MNGPADADLMFACSTNKPCSLDVILASYSQSSSCLLLCLICYANVAQTKRVVIFPSGDIIDSSSHCFVLSSVWYKYICSINHIPRTISRIEAFVLEAWDLITLACVIPDFITSNKKCITLKTEPQCLTLWLLTKADSAFQVFYCDFVEHKKSTRASTD